MPFSRLGMYLRHGLIIPIPKGHNRDMTNPSNYRGITLSSVLSKVFEKIILLRLVDQASQLNPLQGGFRSGHSCLHTAFILQETISLFVTRGRRHLLPLLMSKKLLIQYGILASCLNSLNIDFPSISGVSLTHGIVVQHLLCSGILLFHVPSVSSWMIYWTVLWL